MTWIKELMMMIIMMIANLVCWLVIFLFHCFSRLLFGITVNRKFFFRLNIITNIETWCRFKVDWIIFFLSSSTSSIRFETITFYYLATINVPSSSSSSSVMIVFNFFTHFCRFRLNDNEKQGGHPICYDDNVIRFNYRWCSIIFFLFWDIFTI